MRAKNEELWVEWANRVERWAESGLTAAEFAAEIGVEPKALMQWKYKLRAEQKRAVGGSVSVEASESAAPALRLVPSAESSKAPKRGKQKRSVSVEASESAAPGALEVVFANGVTLRVGRDFDEATLVRVVTLLGGKQ